MTFRTHYIISMYASMTFRNRFIIFAYAGITNENQGKPLILFYPIVAHVLKQDKRELDYSGNAQTGRTDSPSERKVLPQTTLPQSKPRLYA